MSTSKVPAAHADASGTLCPCLELFPLSRQLEPDGCGSHLLRGEQLVFTFCLWQTDLHYLPIPSRLFLLACLKLHEAK